VNKKVVIMVGHGGYLAKQVREYHVGRNTAKLWILNTRIKNKTNTTNYQNNLITI